MSDIQLWCPQCGPIAVVGGVDEDECCVTCGADRITDAVVARIQREAMQEFALVPVDTDDGEMETPAGFVTLQLADIDDGFTFVGVHRDLQPGEFETMLQVLEKANRDRVPPRQFCVLNGQIGEKYQVLRAITKAKYDDDFGEENPKARANG